MTTTAKELLATIGSVMNATEKLFNQGKISTSEALVIVDFLQGKLDSIRKIKNRIRAQGAES